MNAGNEPGNISPEPTRSTDKNFTGISGIVKNLDLNKQTAEVSVSMFGRETIIELKLEDIVPIN